MEPFWKASALTLIGAIISVVVGKQEKDFGLLVTIAACLMVTAITVTYLEPVLDFLHSLESIGDLQSDMLKNLIQIVGVGVAAEIFSMICTDAGNASLAKAVQLLSAAVILYLSIPMFTSLMTMIQQILGAL